MSTILQMMAPPYGLLHREKVYSAGTIVDIQHIVYLQKLFWLRSNRISSLLHRNDWIFIGDDKGGISGYHLKEKQWYIWDNGRNLEFSRIDALEYGNGQLFYSTLAAVYTKFIG